MRNVWKKIKEKWLDYWQDDMLDRTAFCGAQRTPMRFRADAQQR